MAAILSFLAGTKAGRALGISAIAIALIAGAWVWGDVHGHQTQSAKDAKAIATAVARAEAAEQANATNQATITALKAANSTWAAQAASSEASGAKAVQSLTEQQKALKMRYDALQAKLARTVNEDGNAHAWACTALPDSIVELLTGAPASSLRHDASGKNRDCESVNTRDPTNTQGIDAAGAGAEAAHGY